MIDRIPPHDTDAEQSVLGAMLSSMKAATRGIGMLEPEDFYKPAHNEIFQAIGDIARRGDVPDGLLLADELKIRGSLADVGGKAYIHELLDSYPVASSLPRYAMVVRGHSLRRQLITIAQDVQDMAYDHGDTEELVAKAEMSIMSLAHQQTQERGPEDLVTLLPGLMERIEELAEADQDPTFRIGISEIDDLALFQPGRYITIGAATSKGKTSLMAQITSAAADFGWRCLFESLEMPRQDMAKRFLGQRSDVTVGSLNSPRGLGEKEWALLGTAAGKVPRGILIDDGEMDVNKLLARARRVISEGGLDLLIVDYVQLVKGVGKFGTREQEIGSVSRALKQFANQTGVCIVTGAQLNRDFEKDKRRPTNRDLRESGSLEQDSDGVIMIHWPAKKKGEVELTMLKQIELIVSKNRHGPTGITEAFFDAPNNLFTGG